MITRHKKYLAQCTTSLPRKLDHCLPNCNGQCTIDACFGAFTKDLEAVVECDCKGDFMITIDYSPKKEEKKA